MYSPFHLLHHHMGSLLDAFDHETYTAPLQAQGGYGSGQRGYQRQQSDMYRALYEPTPTYHHHCPQPLYQVIDFSLPLAALQEEDMGVGAQGPQRQVKSPQGPVSVNMQQQAVPQPGRPSQATTTGDNSQQQAAARSEDGQNDQLNTLFRSLFRPATSQSLINTPSELAPLQRLRVDVSEDQFGMTVKAEIAGLAKEDVQLTVKDHVLTIGATKQSKGEQSDMQAAAAGKEPAEEKKRGEDTEVKPAAEHAKSPQPLASRVLHRELYYGSVSRSLRLPRQADISQISAEAKDGLLTVRVPYKQSKEPEQHTITIN